MITKYLQLQEMSEVPMREKRYTIIIVFQHNENTDLKFIRAATVYKGKIELAGEESVVGPIWIGLNLEDYEKEYSCKAVGFSHDSKIKFKEHDSEKCIHTPDPIEFRDNFLGLLEETYSDIIGEKDKFEESDFKEDSLNFKVFSKEHQCQKNIYLYEVLGLMFKKIKSLEEKVKGFEDY